MEAQVLMSVRGSCLAHHLFIKVFQRNALMIVIDLRNDHGRFAAGAGQGVIAEGKQDGFSPAIERDHKALILCGADPAEDLIGLSVPGIQPVVADHFEVLFRDVLHEEFNELDGRERSFHICVILMPVVMKCDSIGLPVIAVDPFCSDDGTPKVTPDVFRHGL